MTRLATPLLDADRQIAQAEALIDRQRQLVDDLEADDRAANEARKRLEQAMAAVLLMQRQRAIIIGVECGAAVEFGSPGS